MSEIKVLGFWYRTPQRPPLKIKGEIEWSLRALASLRTVRLFLRARAVIKFVLRAASTLENTDGEHRALRIFSRRNLDFYFIAKKRFAPSNLADTVQPIPAAYSQLYPVGWPITSGSFA